MLYYLVAQKEDYDGKFWIFAKDLVGEKRELQFLSISRRVLKMEVIHLSKKSLLKVLAIKKRPSITSGNIKKKKTTSETIRDESWGGA